MGDTVRSAINLSASHTRENTDPPPRARLSVPTPLLLLMPPTDSTELMLLSPTESTPSMPQSMLDMLLMTLLSLPHTLTPMLLLMTTLVQLSSRLRTMTELVLLMENTLSTFLTAEPNTSSTTPTTMMVMLLMSPMRESHIMLLLPQLLMLSMPQLTMLSMPQFLPMLSMPQFLLMLQLMLF